MPDSPRPPIPASPCPLRVLIADDHPMMVDGLRFLLEANGFEIAGTAADGQAAVTRALELEPDLVLMDISMPVMNGLEATRRIKAQRPEMKIVMLTTSAENYDLFEAIKSGANGYLLKVTTGPGFIEALRGLEQGVPPFSPGLAALLLREFARIGEEGRGDAERNDAETWRHGDAEKESPRLRVSASPCLLNERQTEVLRMVASGLTYKQVGEKLCLSEATVRYHMVEVMHILHLENRNQVIAYAGKYMTR
jgi:DNA-binding NarL/FixJ family response regulator